MHTPEDIKKFIDSDARIKVSSQEIQNKDDSDIIILARKCEDKVLETGTIVETDESVEPTDWLHRNDNYVPESRGSCTVHTNPLPTSGK
ncbi:hypothetical protein BDA96_01G278700 [Sorghum bicolor]|uniref:Uncharacterized protein n=1 Tax=Sorghum bicolor TaxID=4558 RepID=A0A921S026_SORBI|nr:hypothetical protein BDA96_01G278700 [Sorghum bicolor]